MPGPTCGAGPTFPARSTARRGPPRRASGGCVSPGVSVMGVPLGRLHEAEPSAALRPRSDALLNRTILLRASDQQWTVAARDLGLRLDLDRLAAQAITHGREGPIPLRLAY